MFRNNNLGVIKVKKEIFSPEVTQQLHLLHAMLEDRYGQEDADSIMLPYLTFKNQSRH